MLPSYCQLKDVPIDRLTGKSPIYYVPLGINVFKIEPKIQSKRYGENEIVGWRIFISLDVTASLVKNSVYQMPIQKIEGKVADFYSLYLDEREFREVSNSNPNMDSNGQKSKQITHPILEKIMMYVYSNYNKIKFSLNIDEILDERRKKDSSGFNFSILFIDENIAPSLIIPTSKQKGYFNPEESDLLSLDDISKITLNMPKINEETKKKISKLLEDMFLSDDYKNGNLSTKDLLEIHSCIRDYLNSKTPSQNGIVLYGPPGTGKTHLIQSSLMEIYKEIGFKTHFQEIGDMLSNQYVGGLATNVTNKIFGPAITLVKEHRVPCFVYIDEATDLLRKGRSEGDSGWRTQGIEAMKSFINRSRYPGIIVCLATNLEKSEFDDALTRDGRLYKIYLGLPNFERCKQVWNYTNKYILFEKKNSISFNESQIEDLANICKDKINVAAITEISRIYVSSVNISWDGNFEIFKAYFGIEVKKRLEDEFLRAKSNLEQISTGRFIGSRELEEKILDLEVNYKKQLHEIEVALNPKMASTKSGIANLFQNLFSNKSKVPKKYERFVEIITEWKLLIERDVNHDPFSKRSLSLIKGSIAFINWLEVNLDNNTYFELKKKLKIISSIFSEILLVNIKHYEYNNFDMSKLIQLIKIIESLDKKLTEIDFSSRLVDTKNSNSFLEQSGFQIADPRDLNKRR